MNDEIKQRLKKYFCDTHIKLKYGTFRCKTVDSGSQKECDTCKKIELLTKDKPTEKELDWLDENKIR